MQTANETSSLHLFYTVGDNTDKHKHFLAPARTLHMYSTTPFYVADIVRLGHPASVTEYLVAAELQPSGEYLSQLSKFAASDEELLKCAEERDDIYFLTPAQAQALQAVYQEWNALPEEKQNWGRETRNLEERFDNLVEAIKDNPVSLVYTYRP